MSGRPLASSYAPSTGHMLISLVCDLGGVRRENYLDLIDNNREEIEALVGPDRLEWAITQLEHTPRYVSPGWMTLREVEEGGLYA